MVLGTTTDSSRVPPNLSSCFKQEIIFEVRQLFSYIHTCAHAMQAPNEGERLEIINCLLLDQKIASDVSLQSVATQTAALLAGDLCDLITRAKSAAVERAMLVHFPPPPYQRPSNPPF